MRHTKTEIHEALANHTLAQLGLKLVFSFQEFNAVSGADIPEFRAEVNVHRIHDNCWITTIAGGTFTRDKELAETELAQLKLKYEEQK